MENIKKNNETKKKIIKKRNLRIFKEHLKEEDETSRIFMTREINIRYFIPFLDK